MQIRLAKFLMSNTDYQKCPKPNLPEYAFIGRSNVGKSSLINALANNQKLAKTSGQPGKTQTINHFLVNDSWYLVDLPGYGYARVSKEDRKKFAKMIDEYLTYRENLQCVFVLIDVRIEPQKNDLEFLTWLGENEVPFLLVFTKADKISDKEAEENVESFKTAFMEIFDEFPQYFITSAENRQGLPEILKLIDGLNKEFGK